SSWPHFLIASKTFCIVHVSVKTSQVKLAINQRKKRHTRRGDQSRVSAVNLPRKSARRTSVFRVPAQPAGNPRARHPRWKRRLANGTGKRRKSQPDAAVQGWEAKLRITKRPGRASISDTIHGKTHSLVAVYREVKN